MPDGDDLARSPLGLLLSKNQCYKLVQELKKIREELPPKDPDIHTRLIEFLEPYKDQLLEKGVDHVIFAKELEKSLLEGTT